MRKIKHLNYDWQFARGWDKELLTVVNLPHTNTLSNYSYLNNNSLYMKSRYKKRVFLKPLAGFDVILKFYGVAVNCGIFIDGKFVSEHKGAYNAFEVDLTKYVTSEKAYEIEVRVDASKETIENYYGKYIDYPIYGGIYREVEIKYLPVNRLNNLYIYTKYQDSYELYVESDVLGKATHAIITVGELELRADVHENKISYHNVISNIKNWTLDNPVLYDIKVRLFYKDHLLDFENKTIGFRNIEFKRDGFYINQQKTKLLGVNRHQAYPYVGFAMPKSMQVQDADIIKYYLGCNFVYTNHYPVSEHFLNRCDQIGLLVICSAEQTNNNLDQEYIKKSLKDMILQHRNHASIILWNTNTDSLTNTNVVDGLDDIIKKYDPTRIPCSTTNYLKTHFNESIDIYKNFIVNNDHKVKSSLQAKYKNHLDAYQINKFNDREYASLNNALSYASKISLVNSDNNVYGFIAAYMSDYVSNNGYGDNDNVNRNGLLNGFRVKKLVSYIYASQTDYNPILRLCTYAEEQSLNNHSTKTIIAFTNCDYIELYNGEELIKRFDANRSYYSNLKHPPIIIDDFIGNQLETVENYQHSQAIVLKDILDSFRMKCLDHYDSKDIIKLNKSLTKIDVTYDKLLELYHKYVYGVGDNQEYKVIGYKDNNPSITKYYRNNVEINYIANLSSDVLEDANTYDVVQVFIQAVDNQHNELYDHYTNVSVLPNTMVEVLGPTHFPLIAGQASFYVKSKGVSGKTKIEMIVGNNKIEIILDIKSGNR